MQDRFNNIKQKKIKDYIKYLRKLSVTPGIETISEQLEAATEATTAVPSSKNKTPKKKAAKKTGATKKMSTKKTEDTSEDETWELGNDEESICYCYAQVYTVLCQSASDIYTSLQGSI